MPRTLKNIWQQLTCFENLFLAWRRARENKQCLPSVLSFKKRLEENLFIIQGQLLHKTWLPGAYRGFWVNKPKMRFVQAPPFRDRVVHHALANVVLPAFERRFIPDSFACRVGRGQTNAGLRLTEFLREAIKENDRKGRKTYALKADIHKYFPHIRHDILKAQIRRTVGDPDVLWLMDRIIDESGYEECGLPIGALTSQLYANIYLDVFDHYVKDELGIRCYVRYMDDFVILDSNKRRLHDTQIRLGDILYERLRLTYNPKTVIFPAFRGIDFSGYRHWPDYRLPRKRNIKNWRKRFKMMMKQYAKGRMTVDEVRSRVASFLGYTKHCKAHETVKSILEEVMFQRKCEYEEAS